LGAKPPPEAGGQKACLPRRSRRRQGRGLGVRQLADCPPAVERRHGGRGGWKTPKQSKLATG